MGADWASERCARVLAVRHADVHVITRLPPEAAEFGRFAPMYEQLGLRAALLTDGEWEVRKAAYTADVVYSGTYEPCYDYVRDNLAWDPQECVQRGRRVVILDRIDDILLRQGRAPAVIGDTVDESARCREFQEQVRPLRREVDFEVSGRLARLTPRGLRRLGLDDVPAPSALVRRRMAEAALAAAHCFHRGERYTVRDGVVAGQVPEGVRQALEAKEGVAVTGVRHTLGEILPWDYYRDYDTLVGLSPTAAVAAPALDELAGTAVVEVKNGAPPVLVGSDQDRDSPMSRFLRQWVAEMLEFTDVRRRHREAMHDYRRTFLTGRDDDFAARTLDSVVSGYVAARHPDAHGLHKDLSELYATPLTEDDLTGEKEQVLARVHADARAALERRWRDLGAGFAADLARRVTVIVIDRVWREHLIALDYLSCRLTEDDPRDVRARYHRRAAALYDATVHQIHEHAMGYLFNLHVQDQ
jgi:preprotein translocase subunit SecA